MFKHYVIFAMRQIFKHKLFSFINMIGLAVGIACSVLILLFTWNEFSYDQCHINVDRIYRVIREKGTGFEKISYVTTSPGAMATALKKDLPEVIRATRVWRNQAWVIHEGQHVSQTICQADPEILDIFSFPIVKGNVQALSQNPWAIFITQEMAQKYFGTENPLEKTLTLEQRYLSGTYKIAGILNMPKHSTLTFDFLITTNTKSRVPQDYWQDWMPDMDHRLVETYLLLDRNTNLKALIDKLPHFISQYIPPEHLPINQYHLQPLNRIHLYSNIDYGMRSNGDITYIRTLSFIGFFILLIACINFMNLTTARSIMRSKEVGLRKVVGARRVQLIGQFLGESILLSLVALLLGLCLTQAFLPIFNDFTEKSLSLTRRLHEGRSLLTLCGLTLCIGLVAGAYPAFFLSTFQPNTVLKGHSAAQLKGIWLRRGLVILQFSVAICFLVGSIVVYRQLMFMRSKDLGFDQEHIVYMPLFSTDRNQKRAYEGELSRKYNVVKDAFLQHPNILKVSASMALPGWVGGTPIFYQEGKTNSDLQVSLIAIDEDFLELYDIEFIAGRNFEKSYVEQRHITRRDKGISEQYIINETAAKLWGWNDPLKNRIRQQTEVRREGPVIGVVKDFHVKSLREKLGPVVIWTWREKMNWLSMKIGSDNVQETLAFIEKTWQTFLPNRPFTYQFMDDRMDRLHYRQDQQLAQLLSIAFLLSIFVASLGLLALVSFTTLQRTKEIGIRKVLGASTKEIFRMLSLDFAKWIFIANLIAWPVVYYTMNRWLQDFAYRIALGPEFLFLGSSLALGIAFLAVSFQTIKAARANPIDALKHE